MIDKSKVCMLGSNGEGGFPQIKAMLVANDGFNTIWFSTNTSSKRVAQLLKDPKAAVYFVDSDNFKGEMLNGKVEVMQNHKTKACF